MKEQSFDNDVNSLTGMSNSNSGAPSAIDEQAPTDAFERSWDWDFEVRELGPDETAECKVTMGADDLANLTVDGEERLDIGKQIYNNEINKSDVAIKYRIGEGTARDYMRLY